MLEQIYSLTWEYKWTCTVAKLFLLTKIQLSTLSFAPKGSSKLCFLSCQLRIPAAWENCWGRTVQPASAPGDKHCLKTQNKAELPESVSLYRSRQKRLCWCTTLCNSLEVDCTKEVSGGEEHSLCLRAQVLGLMPDIALKRTFDSYCFHPLTFLLNFAVNPFLSSKGQSDQILHSEKELKEKF